MLTNMLCAVGGVVIGAIGMGMVIWRMYQTYEDNYPYYPEYLDPIEINTPTYEECEEFNELFDGDGEIFLEG